VPQRLTAMANGVLVSNASSGGSTTWTWREADPMATYLSTVDIGRFDLTTSSIDGIPSYVAVDPQLAKGQVLSKLPEIIRFYSSIYGPYPFSAVGAIVDSAKNLGYSLETQTKPLFPYVPDEATLAHEQSHMWFGDSATLGRWPDIWLHEGFATWSEWIWSEHTGQKSAAQYFKQLYSTPASNTAFWNPPPGDPGDAAHLFDGTIYDRGGLTLEALREKIGDDATFFRIMRDEAQQNRFGTVTTPGFVAIAERDSGLDLGKFFQAWLFAPGKPTDW
jgi:aminopeptidase N